MAKGNKTDMSYIDIQIFRKQVFAEKNANETPYDVLEEIKYQIEVMEDLRCGLTEEQILELLNLKTELQVENACRKLKTA